MSQGASTRAQDQVNVGVVVGVVVASVVVVLVLVAIIVPIARRWVQKQHRRRSGADLEGRNCHTRVASGLDSHQPLLHFEPFKFSPPSGDLNSLSPPMAEVHAESGHGRSMSSSHTLPVAASNAITPENDLDSTGRTTSTTSDPTPSSQPTLPTPQPISPTPGAPALEHTSTSRNILGGRTRLALPHAPMETLAEAPDGSVAHFSPPAQSPPLSSASTDNWQTGVMGALASNPLTGAFRLSLRSDTTGPSRNSSATSVVHRYPSFTASSTTYYTSEEGPRRSGSNLSLNTSSSRAHTVHPRPSLATSGRPQAETRTDRRAHLRSSDSEQRPEYHDQQELSPPRLISRHASFEFVEAQGNEPAHFRPSH